MPDLWLEPNTLCSVPVEGVQQPRPGERVLEIGPGIGQEAVAVAGWLGPSGRLDVVDVQQEMLDATLARARHAGVANVHAVLADGSGMLPAEEAAFDAAYLSSVLGEVPDRVALLRELRRTNVPKRRLEDVPMSRPAPFTRCGRRSS